MKTIVKDENLLDTHRLRNYDYQVGILNNDTQEDTYVNELAVRFNGIYRLLDFIEEHKAFGNRRPKSDDTSFESRDSDDWVKFETYDKAVNAMRKTPEAFRSFNENDLRLYDEETVGNKIAFDKSGDYIDIGKYLEGNPDCFGVMQGGRFERRFCSIVINISASCNVDKSTIEQKAKRTLRLIDFLEMNGVRCEVGILSSTTQVHCEVIIKNYRDALDINEVAIGLSPDFFRWVVFRLTEHSEKWGWGYGRPCDASEGEWNDAEADNTIYIGALHDNSDVDKEFDKVEKVLKEDGLEQGRNFDIRF